MGRYDKPHKCASKGCSVIVTTKCAVCPECNRAASKKRLAVPHRCSGRGCSVVVTTKSSTCSYHTRLYKLVGRYGLTVADYDAMLVAQGGRCAICPATEPGGNGVFRVDHRHVEGWSNLSTEEKRALVRGLLCNDCNLGLGKFRDDHGLLAVASEYVKKFGDQHHVAFSPAPR